MKMIKSFACLLALSFLIASCQNDSEIAGPATYIPATSTSVMSFDIEKLMKKADFESIKKMSFYQDMLQKSADKNQLIADVLKDPTKSGIDLQGQLYVASDLDKDDPERIATHVLVPLASASDFEKLITASDLEYESINGLKYIPTENNQIMTWSDDLLVFSFTNDYETNIKELAMKVFETNPETSIAQNGDFKKAMRSDHDMSAWMTTNSLAKNPAAGMAFNMIDMDPDALEENYVHGYGDFENGKMVGHADFYFNRKMGKGFLGRFFNDGSETNFSEVLPAENLAFAMSTSINLRGIDQFLSERPQSKEYADFVLNDVAGFERNELLKTLNGDVMIAGYHSNGKIDEENFILAVALKNNGKAEEMLKKAEEEKKIKAIEPGYYKILSVGGEGITIRINKGMGTFLHMDNKLVYSPNDELLKKIKNKEIELGGKAVSKTLNNFDEQTMAGWFDFSAFAKNEYDLPNAIFKDVRFNVNANGADFIMETNDPNQNSLKAFFEMMDQMYMDKNMESM